MNSSLCRIALVAQDRAINHAAGSHGVSGIFMKYDINSLMVKVTEQHMPLWQFLVRLCGIIGGIFSTTGWGVLCKTVLNSVQGCMHSQALLFRSRNTWISSQTNVSSFFPGMIHGIVGFLVDVICCRLQMGVYRQLKVRSLHRDLIIFYCFNCHHWSIFLLFFFRKRLRMSKSTVKPRTLLLARPSIAQLQDILTA